MSKVLVNESSLTGIADAIRGKNGTTTTYKPSEMAAAITAIETGSGGGDLPEEALTITGNCSYRFAYNGWSWFIENYVDKITTSDITNCSYMFYYCDNLTSIPFDINLSSSASYVDVSNMFMACFKLTSIPKITGGKPHSTGYMFSNCHNLRNLPDDIADWFDWTYMENQTSAYSCSRNTMFADCHSLRSIPMDFLAHANPNITYSSSYFYYGFKGCCCLDELVNLPIPYTATWTSNVFYNTFNDCYRLKNLTFALKEDGTPYVRNWKSQTIDLSSGVGYSFSNKTGGILNYNSGITADKEVTNAETYQALKDDADWWTIYVNYSRYNHDSAVATINSLPDTSAYLEANGGTNTIKFKGTSGASTDGGAINTLTEEEIAVATAKGWTVTIS